MENIELHLKLVRGIRGTLLAYVVWHNVKVAHISPGCSACLNLDKEMINRVLIFDSSSNLKITQKNLDRAYLSHQVDTFKINNSFVYQILSKMFPDMDAYVYVKQRRRIQNGQVLFFDIHKQNSWP